MIISSRENPNVKMLSKLLSSKKARNESGLFVIEGMRSCVDAAMESTENNMRISALFYTEEAYENYKNSLPLHYFDLVDERKRFVISTELADKISAEGSSQGVFVIAEKLDKRLEEDLVSEKGKYLVLNHLQDPGNIGTLLRTADAVGVSGVVLTNNCCDIYNPKVVRSTMGSLARVEIFVENDFSRVCEIFEKKGVDTLAAVVSGGTSVTGYDFSKPCAVVLGNEGNGLSAEDADMCKDKITIRMNGHIDSLNAAVAGAVILWEMFREQVSGRE